LDKFFKVFTIENVDDNYDDADNDNDGPSNVDVLDAELQENLFPSFEDHDRLDEKVVTVDIRSKSFSCSCRMFENKGFLCRHVFKILEFLGGYVQYHFLKTTPGQYVLKRWTRDMRPSVDKLKSTINVGTEDTTQAQRYQQICAVTVKLSTRFCVDPEESEIFLHGVLEARKKIEELLLSKGIRTYPSSVTPSKSSKAAAVGEPSAGVKSTAPKFKERANPIKSKKRLKSDYEKARERQKFVINRKKQKRDDEALKKSDH